MAGKLNLKQILRRIIAVISAFSILAYGPVPYGSLKEAKAAGNFYIEGSEYENPLSVYYFGVINSFNVHSTGYINVNDTFGCDFELPGTAFTRSDPSSVWGKTVRLYLIPAEEGNQAESFVQAYKDEVWNKIIPVNTWKSSISVSTERVGYSCDNLTLNTGNAPASGYYRFVALVYEEDPVSVDRDKSESLPVIMTISRKAFAFSNPADGGDPGEPPYEDPYEGTYTTLNVSIYAGGDLLEDTTVTVYDKDCQICYGMAPCVVPTNTEVALYLQPGLMEQYLENLFYFPKLKNGDPFITTVPEDGWVEINLEKRSIGAVVSGHVTDENGDPVENAYVSASTNNDMSFSTGTYTDKVGFYSLDGLYACEYLITASKDGYRAVSPVISEYDMNSNAEITTDIVLKEKNTAFSLRFKGIDDEALYNIVIPTLMYSGINLPNGVSGDMVWTDIDTLSFVPDSEVALRDMYTVKFDSEYILTDSITVANGSTAEVALANLAGFRGSVTYKDNKYGRPYVLLFDDEGEIFSNHMSISDNYVFPVVLPEGEKSHTYRSVFYGCLENSYTPDLNYDLMVATYPSELLKREITLEAGHITDMGEAEICVFDPNASTINLLSAITVSGTAQASGDILRVSGHIEDKEAFKLKGLRIYGYGSSERSVTAGYKDGSLVINGHVADASSKVTEDWTNLSKLITINEDVTGPFDFSCILSVYNVTDMVVRVEIDIEKDGVISNNVKVGDYSARVFPITLKTMHRTSTGVIKCTGHAIKEAPVKIWEGEKLLGMTYADSYGKYELSISLPMEGRDYSFHSIHATCDEHSTDDIVVYYDKNTTSVESVTLLGGSTTGSWTFNSAFGFEALVDNPEMITDDAEFNVLCSDGTVVAIPIAEEKACNPYNGVTRSLFVSERYRFGEKNLVPVKVWFVYSSGRNAASDVASLEFYGKEAPVYTGGAGEALNTVTSIGGEIIAEPGKNVALDIVNELTAKLLQTVPQTLKLGAALEYIGIGELVEIYNQTSEAIDANRKRAMADDEMKLLRFMNRVSKELPSDVDTRRFDSEFRVAMDNGANAVDMIDRYREQSFYMAIANTLISKIPTEFIQFKAVGVALQGIVGPAMSEIQSHNDEAWSFYGESMRDASRRFQLMTGLTTPELLKMYEQYNAGQLSGYDIRKILKDRLGEKKDAEAEDGQDLDMLIDPSGYVYEAVASNRIENAVVTLYSEGMVLWNAEAYDQQNPLITDEEGRYAWDVPEGNWFVKVFKEGYEEGTSSDDPAAVVTINGVNYLPVLPPQLDVNIPLTSLSKPVASVEKNGNDICLVFSRYVSVDTVTSDTVKLSGFSSSEYSFTALDAEVSPAHTPGCGGKTLARTFRIDIKNGSVPSGISAEITESVMGYNGISAKGNVTYGTIEETKEGEKEVQIIDPEPVEDDTEKETAIIYEKKTRHMAGKIIAIVIGVLAIGVGAAFLIWRRKRD